MAAPWWIQTTLIVLQQVARAAIHSLGPRGLFAQDLDDFGTPTPIPEKSSHWNLDTVSNVIRTVLYPTLAPTGRSVIVLNELSDATITLLELSQEISAEFIILMCAVGILSVCEHTSIICFFLVRFACRRLYRLYIRLRYGTKISAPPLTDEQASLQLSDTAK